MALSPEIAGTATIYGIGGSGTMTGAATFNAGDMNLSDEFKVDPLPAQDGSIIATKVASQRERRAEINFVPTGASKAAAEAVVTTLMALGKLAVITTASFTVTAFNGTWNYEGGGSVRLTREGYAVCGIKLCASETATPGTFSALAIAT